MVDGIHGGSPSFRQSPAIESPTHSSSRESVLDASLQGRVALITGGGTGVGRATGIGLARAGVRVTLVGRREERLKATAALIEEVGGESLVAVGDIGAADDVDQVFAAHEERFDGHLDILVNNAGITGPTARVADMDTEEWDETLRVNLTGPMLCSKRALPALRASGHGRIINVSSLSAYHARPARSPYAASKAGLLALNRTLAHEEGANGVLVNCICPGTIAGERIEGVLTKRAAERGTTPEEERRLRESQTPIGRILEPEEIANMCIFLASDLASGITGEVINVAGGRQS